MTGPVVCGIDFSEHSKRALAWAHWLATLIDQPLNVVHAVEPMLADAAKVTYGTGALKERIEPELRTFLGDIDARILIGAGEPAGMLMGEAIAAGASVIVAGTQGLGAAARLWFGSTTLTLLRESNIPVLAVPLGAPTEPAVTSIITGTDFSPASRAATGAALELAELTASPVTLLHIVPTVAAHTRWSDLMNDASDAVVRAARARLAADAPKAPHVRSEVRTGNAAEVLIHAATEPGSVVIVGLGGTSGQRPGTTAYRVVSEADAPVFAVPAALA